MKTNKRRREETAVMKALKGFDSNKYEDAEFCERPDIWVKDKSIGVEVTSGVFDDIYLAIKAFNKDIINSKKMMREKPVNFNEIGWVFDYPEADLDKITGSKFLYKDKEKSIKVIDDIPDLKDKLRKYEIWEVGIDEFNRLDQDYKSKVGPGVAIWEGEWHQLLIQRINAKINNFEDYNKFEENNLAVYCFFTDSEDMKEAKEYIIRYYNGLYMPFDNIYLCTDYPDQTICIEFYK